MESILYGRYVVYCNGDIFSTITNKYLSKSMRGKYLKVTINGQQVSVHRLVAKLFINNDNERLQVNHKDGDKFNNSASNLEWVTQSENAKHSFRIGLQTAKMGYNNKQSKQCIRTDKNGENPITYGSLEIASKSIGLKSYSNISRACSGERRSAGGFVWHYA